MALPAAAAVVAGLLALGCPGVTLPDAPVDQGTIANVPRGKVTVSPGQPAFAEGEVVTVRIANGLESTIYAEDMKTDCSVAFLERKDGEEWTRIAGCGLERLPAVVALGSRRVRTARIDPTSFHLGTPQGPSRPALGAGLYRVRFTFRRAPLPLGVEPETALSETFRIGGS